MIQTLQAMCSLSRRWKPAHSNVARMAAWLVIDDRNGNQMQEVRRIDHSLDNATPLQRYAAGYY